MTEQKFSNPLSLAEFKQRRRKLRSVSHIVAEEMSKLDRLAVFITNRVGTIGFFLIILCWTLLWLGWNVLAPRELQFDPPMGFVLWLFISNLIQIMLMPLIMVGQNIQAKHADIRSENDLEVNIKAEQEIELVLHHLEYQNAILIAMLEKQGLKLEEVLQRKSTLL
jgi:uncharacterized membrane protein